MLCADSCDIILLSFSFMLYIEQATVVVSHGGYIEHATVVVSPGGLLTLELSYACCFCYLLLISNYFISSSFSSKFTFYFIAFMTASFSKTTLSTRSFTSYSI